MPTGFELRLLREKYSEQYGLVQAVCRKRCRNRLEKRGVYLSRTALQDVIDDAVARSWKEFCKRYWQADSAKQAALVAGGIASRRVAERRLANLGSERKRGYSDALDHRAADKRIGLEEEQGNVKSHYVPTKEDHQAFQDILDCLPKRLRATAEYASCGVSQVDSAVLQHCTERTVQNHYAEIRPLIGQRVVAGVIGSALQALTQ